jgi:hypothetical protein
VTVLEAVLIARGREHVLSEEPVVVPASEVVLVVRGAPEGLVWLDGEARYLKSTGGILSLDLRRSTGYHRLAVGGHEFWFATDDAKAQLAGISEMLTEMRGLGTGWAGQINFSDGEGLRDPHVVYGWLDHRADRILKQAKSIFEAPSAEQRATRVLSRRGGAGLDVPATLRLIRSDPTRFLEEHSAGAIKVGAVAYMPQRVVRRSQRSTTDTPANRRVVRLVALVRRLADEVYGAGQQRTYQARCLAWRDAADALLRTGLAQGLTRFVDEQESPARAQVELLDKRYEFSFRMLKEASGRFGWTPGAHPLRHYSYVQRSDSIYQAYCAAVIGRTLGLEQTDVVLGRRQPAFVGHNTELYFNAVLPGNVLRSWRSVSAKPDSSRPDIVLYRPNSGEVAVIDAKYRLSENAASEDSRKEVSAYMALYGIDRIGVAYPGSGDVQVVRGYGREIHELPIRPPATALDEMRKAVDALFTRSRFEPA